MAVGDSGRRRRRWVLLVGTEMVVRRHYGWKTDRAMHARIVEVVLTADRWLGLLQQGGVARMSKSGRAVGTNNKGFVS